MDSSNAFNFKDAGDYEKIALLIYRDFGESYEDNHPFQTAWDDYQHRVRDINIGDETDTLVLQAISYAIEKYAEQLKQVEQEQRTEIE